MMAWEEEEEEEEREGGDREARISRAVLTWSFDKSINEKKWGSNQNQSR